MAYVKELCRRLLHLTRRAKFHSELSDEIQEHIECRADELEQSGIPRAEALARARQEFESVAKAAEDTRDAWRLRWIEDLAGDLRYAGRALRRNPGFALTAIACLALGIGVNTTIFNITTSVLFSLPSCRDASSLVALWLGGNSSRPMSDYKFIRNAHIFEGMAGINPEREVNWRTGDQTTRLSAGLVTDDYFSVLDVPFQLGRGIAPGETDTAVLSHRLWQGRFGSDPSVLGRGIVLDGRTHTVVGVLPPDHRTIVGFGFSPDIYVPAVHPGDSVQFYARLPEGTNRASARAQLQRVLQELDRIDPKREWKRSANVRLTGVTGIDLLSEQGMEPVLAFFALLIIVVGLVLLIACTNVAGLLLARGASRSQELAIRLSLGASRMRIVRHLLAESLLLAVLGTMAGLLIDVACGRLVSRLQLPLPLPIQPVVRIDWRLLFYAMVVAVLSALIAGLMPALRAVRKYANAGLKSGQRLTDRPWGLRSVLVTGQLAVSVVLLATGFLFVHNLLRAISINPGFDTQHAVWAYMRLVPEKYEGQNRQTALVTEALNRLRALPGVEAAAITQHLPLNDNCVIGADVTTDLSSTARPVEYQCINVGPQYFRAIGIPLLRGREFSSGDSNASERVAIVNETFARTIFGNRDPIGHTITDFVATRRVVGVAKDSRYFTLGERQRLAMYEPYFGKEEPVDLNFIVRTYGTPSAYVKPVTDALGRLDSSAAIETKPIIQSMGMALLPSKAGAVMLGALGILGLVLAAIGLYGVLLYSVARRTREIGLRIALGATPAGVLRVVCQQAFGLVGAGTAIGLALASLATRPLALFLVPGLSTYDAGAFVAVIGVLGGVSLLATLGPAFRALRTDPTTALRYE